jgi:hypothetical protein
MIIDSLMEGMNLNIGFSLLNRLDEIILSILKSIEEQKLKEKREEKKTSEEEANKAETIDQHHMIHTLSLILKSKISAKFKLQYIQDFQNNFLSSLSAGGRDAFTITPSAAVPILGGLQEVYENLTTEEDIDKISESLIE